MSKLLLDEPPLLVLPKLATAVGLNEAIVLQQLHYWLLASEHVINDRHWVYNSYADWQKQFPFWSVHTVRRALSGLRQRGLILVDRFNKKPYDKTNWYTIDYERLAKLASGIAQNGQMEVAILGTPIPETTTETTTENEGDDFSDLFSMEEKSKPQDTGLRERLQAGQLTGTDLAKALGLTAKASIEDRLCGLFAELWGRTPWPSPSQREQIIWEEFAADLVNRCGKDWDGLRQAISFYFTSPDWEGSVQRITTPKGAVDAITRIYRGKEWHLEAETREPIEQGPLIEGVKAAEEPTFWDIVLKNLSYEVTQATFTDWLQPTTAEEKDGEVIVYAPNPNAKEWLQHRLAKKIEAATADVLGREVKVGYEVSDDQGSNRRGLQ